MEIKRNVLVLIVVDNKVLLCKRKDGQYWGGLLADISFYNSPDMVRDTQKYIQEKFGILPKELTERGLVTKKIFDGEKEPNCEISQVFVAENFAGQPKNDEYEFEWVGNYKLMTKSLEGGDYYWLGPVVRGTNMRVWMSYDKSNNLLTYNSEPPVIDFSLKDVGKN